MPAEESSLAYVPTLLATLNYRSHSTTWKQGELVAEADKLNLTAIGIQEHRIQCTEPVKYLDLNGGWKFIHSSADTSGNGGVGLLLNPRVYSALGSVIHISQHILKFTFSTKCSKSWPKLDILVCYSPMSASLQEDVDSFYASLQHAMDEVGQHAFLTILGNWNARLPQTSQHPWVYSNILHRDNDSFCDFLAANLMFSANTSFRKVPDRLYTHRSS